MARGGSRPGAGRPKKSKTVRRAAVLEAEKVLTSASPEVDTKFETFRGFAMHVINDASADMADKVRLAIAGMAYEMKADATGAKGKKEQAQEAAQEAASGKFAPPKPPRLVVNNE